MNHSDMDHSGMDHGHMHHEHMDHDHMNHGDDDYDDVHHDHHDHQGMDHGTMDHGSMKMYFHVGNEALILFAGWQTVTGWQMFGSCLVMIIVAALYEGLKVLREFLQIRSTVRSAVDQKREPLNVATVDGGPSATTVFRVKHSTSWPAHIVQVLLHMLQVTISYLLMLVFMTYNVWLCLSVVIGAGLGYLLFGRLRSSVTDRNEHCN